GVSGAARASPGGHTGAFAGAAVGGVRTLGCGPAGGGSAQRLTAACRLFPMPRGGTPMSARHVDRPAVLVSERRAEPGRRTACLTWFAALGWLALLPLPAGAQISKRVPDAVPRPEAPPALFLGRLTKADPLDRVQKQSHARVYEIEMQAGKFY